MHINVIRDQTLPDEHLYGRCGYLTALLFVQHHLGADKVDRELIVKVKQYNYTSIWDGQYLLTVGLLFLCVWSS